MVVTVRSSAARRARADVQPIAWKIPAAGVAVWPLAALLVLPAGQGAASLLFGGGWVWPRGCSAVVSSIGGLVTVHPGRGLAAGEVGQLPVAGVVYLLEVESVLGRSRLRRACKVIRPDLCDAQPRASGAVSIR
jgi:hypothetical protein